ncbi:MAG: T9SS type A sorting domain-containing protein [Saprospiraceae bacterium]
MAVDNGSQLTYDITVTNTSPTMTAATAVEVSDELASGTTFSAATGAPFEVVSNVVTWTIPTIAADETVALSVTVNVNTPEGATIQEDFDFESGAQDWVGSVGVANAWTLKTDSDGHDGSTNYFFCPNTNNNEPVSYLTYTPGLDINMTGKQLRFWHKFDTDSGFDGGFIETTSDGTTWARMPLQENAYNGALDSRFNPANAGQAYTGKRDDYFESAGTIPDNATGIRFVLSEDAGGGSGVGWWIDDIRIVTNPIKITNIVTVTDPVTNGGRVKSADASTLVIGESALAVEFLSLSAEALENAIKLSWATASEEDNAGFYIERQAKGETTFTEIGFVAGQNQAANYSYLDKTALANIDYTYRLRQVDYAAKASYSNLVSAMIERAGVTFNVNPNPASTFTEVRLENVSAGQLKVLSTDGRLLRSYEIGNDPSQRIRVDVSDLAQGIYLLQYQNNTEQIVERIIVK